MSLIVNDKVIVLSCPASAYHKMHGEEVLIIDINKHPSGKDEDKIYTFVHPKYGPGALYAHGLTKDENFYGFPGYYKKEEVVKRPMFDRFLKQKLTTKLGEVELEDGRVVVSYLHSSLGFIAAYSEEIINDTYVGSR